MGAHERLREVTVTTKESVEDLDVLGMRAAPAVRVAEVDRQSLLTHDVVDAAYLVENAVLRRPYDLEVEVAVLSRKPFTGGKLLLRHLQYLPELFEVFLRCPGAGKLGGLDLVNLAQLDAFVDLDRIERNARSSEQRHRLDAGLVGGQVDSGLRPPFDNAHGFENRERLSDLAAA
jgi:hypothetical protein